MLDVWGDFLVREFAPLPGEALDPHVPKFAREILVHVVAFVFFDAAVVHIEPTQLVLSGVDRVRPRAVISLKQFNTSVYIDLQIEMIFLTNYGRRNQA